MGNIITLEDVKVGLPIRTGNTQFDTELNGLIAVVEEQIEMYTRRKFELAIYSELFHVQSGATRHYDFLSDTNTSGIFLAPNGFPFVLSNGPLAEDAEVKVYYNLNHTFTEEERLFEDDFVVLPERNCVYVNRPLVQSRDSVKIVYEGGYAETPAAVKLAARMQVQHLFQRTQAENVSTASDKDNGAKEPYTTKSGLLPEAANMLAPYRKLLRGRG